MMTRYFNWADQFDAGLPIILIITLPILLAAFIYDHLFGAP